MFRCVFRCVFYGAGTGLEPGWDWVGTGLEWGWNRVGFALEPGWIRVGSFYCISDQVETGLDALFFEFWHVGLLSSIVQCFVLTRLGSHDET